MGGISGTSSEFCKDMDAFCVDLVNLDIQLVGRKVRQNTKTADFLSFLVSLSLMIQQYNVKFTRTRVPGCNLPYSSQGGMRLESML